MTDWPVALRGVTETVVTTLGPNEMWNAAALGIHAPWSGAEQASGDAASHAPRSDAERANAGGVSHAPRSEDPVMATTWGDTRTRRNFHRRGGGVVQFVSDPVAFVDAALSVHEIDDPVLDAADAWARVDATHVGTDAEDGTSREHWELRPVETGVVRESPHTIDRGFNAVVEATVAASRLDVPSYDTGTLRERLDYFASVVESCGGEREREAMARVAAHSAWDASQNESF